MTLGQLTILAAEAAGEGEESFFGGIAASWNEGGWPMYPIAMVFVVGLAITVERAIVLFATASINKDGFIRGLKKHIYAGDLDKAINYVAGQKPTPSQFSSIQAPNAPIMYWAPWAKLMTLSMPKITASPRLSKA